MIDLRDDKNVRPSPTSARIDADRAVGAEAGDCAAEATCSTGTQRERRAAAAEIEARRRTGEESAVALAEAGFAAGGTSLSYAETGAVAATAGVEAGIGTDRPLGAGTGEDTTITARCSGALARCDGGAAAAIVEAHAAALEARSFALHGERPALPDVARAGATGIAEHNGERPAATAGVGDLAGAEQAIARGVAGPRTTVTAAAPGRPGKLTASTTRIVGEVITAETLGAIADIPAAGAAGVTRSGSERRATAAVVEARVATDNLAITVANNRSALAAALPERPGNRAAATAGIRRRIGADDRLGRGAEVGAAAAARIAGIVRQQTATAAAVCESRNTDKARQVRRAGVGAAERFGARVTRRSSEAAAAAADVEAGIVANKGALRCADKRAAGTAGVAGRPGKDTAATTGVERARFAEKLLSIRRADPGRAVCSAGITGLSAERRAAAAGIEARVDAIHIVDAVAEIYAAGAAGCEWVVRERRAATAAVRARVVAGDALRAGADPLTATSACETGLRFERAATAAGIEAGVVADHGVRGLADEEAAATAGPAGVERQGGATATSVAAGANAGERILAIAGELASATAGSADGSAEDVAATAAIQRAVVAED